MALSTAATEFARALDVLGLAQHRIARWFSVGARSVRRWQHGDRRVPAGVAVVLRLLAARMITVAEVEQVAISARTNGGAKKEPPTRAEPAPRQSASVRARTATLADRNLTTAEKIVALAADACRWPYGDPRDRNFHFCSKPTARGSYCERHRAMAYLAPRPGRGRGHVGFVVHGRHGRPPIPSAVSTADAAQAPTARAAFPAAHRRPLDREASPC